MNATRLRQISGPGGSPEPHRGKRTTRDDQRDGGARALRERLSRLTGASLRVHESLDLDTVLPGVLESAIALTGALHGTLILLDGTGRVEASHSSGASADSANGLVRCLGRIGPPVRLPDLHAHLRSLGLPDELEHPTPERRPVPLLAAPMHHRDEHVGDIFLTGRNDGGEFTQEDEESLAAFAPQAALAIANARRHLDEQRARGDLQAIIDTCLVGVVVLDASAGSPVSFNREAKRIIESLKDQDISKGELFSLLTVHRTDGSESPWEEIPLAQALESGETALAQEAVIRGPGGRSVSVLMNVSAIPGRDGSPAVRVATFQDITALQETDRLRAELLAMVSHELRTPLAAIKGSVTTVMDPDVLRNPDEAVQFHRIIDSQADQMRTLITDLLDMARIETGGLVTATRPTDLGALASEAANTFQMGEAAHGLHLEMQPDLPWVMADRPRILQVLSNLLANAARHSPESSAIVVSAARQGSHVAVSVSDNGVGIPAGDLPRLFRKFSRAGSDGQNGHAGLGLAICKGIVEAHGGQIWAQSDGPGRGARFTFTIPIASPDGNHDADDAGAFRQLPRESMDGNQARVLVVDDDPQALRFINDVLVNAGYTVIATIHPDDVRRLVDDGQPDMVLLDLMLPNTDGVELMAHIREWTLAPVIFVSAYGRDHLIARALGAGAIDYVVKPFSPTELLARIRAALRKSRTPNASPPYAQGELAIDYANRRVTLCGEPVRLTSMEYRTLVELATNAGRVVTYGHLQQRVWNARADADLRPIRTVISAIRRRLGDDADRPTYIFTETKVGYRMLASAPSP